MRLVDEIEIKLRAAFSPYELIVTDESEKHRGHSGWREGGETHFQVRMRAGALDGLGPVAAHRAVHGALGPVLIQRLHALGLDVGGSGKP